MELRITVILNFRTEPKYKKSKVEPRNPVKLGARLALFFMSPRYTSDYIHFFQNMEIDNGLHDTIKKQQKYIDFSKTFIGLHYSYIKICYNFLERWREKSWDFLKVKKKKNS